MARSTETDQETALYWVKKGTRVKKIYISQTPHQKIPPHS